MIQKYPLWSCPLVKPRLNTVKEKLKLEASVKKPLNLNRMKAKPYQLISSLMLLGVMGILAFQMFWIHSAYQQRKTEFTQSLLYALEQVGNKLSEQQGLQELKRELDSNTVVFSNAADHQIRVQTFATRTIVTSGTTIHKGNEHVSLDSLTEIAKRMSGNRDLQLHKPKLSGVYSITNELESKHVRSAEQQKLLDKVIYEIRIMDNPLVSMDSLKGLIKRVLQNKGFTFPFEFSLRHQFKEKEKVLLESPGFKSDEEALRSDLSLNNVIKTHQFLYLQIPDSYKWVMASLKTSLLLATFFSIMMIALFYYTHRLILKQKKIGDMKTDFVNNMTHELKTPIATISLAVDAMSNPIVRENEKKQEEYRNIIKEESSKLNTHVERVLLAAKEDHGTLELDKSNLQLDALLKEVLDGFHLQAEAKRAVIDFTRPPSPVYFFGDARHLKALFANLLDNALKYHNASPFISIRVQKLDRSIRVSVSDNGIGMTKEQLSKIFERFYRAQSGNVHDVKGFGLGLSYVKSMVEAHGGKILVKSEMGKGTEFIIEFENE